MSQPIWTPARSVHEVEDHGLIFRFTVERGEIVDAEIEIEDGARAARRWRGLGKIVQHAPAERDGDAERDAALDVEGSK